MTKPIHSYEDLLKEKDRLEGLLQVQRGVIRQDIQELKAQLQPIGDAVEFVKKLTTKDKSSLLLNIGSEIIINSVFKQFILSRAGWLMRTVIPFFLKNYSSHFLGEHKDKWLEKLKSWIGHKNGKEQKKQKEKREDESHKDHK